MSDPVTTDPVVTETETPESPVQLPADHPLVKTLSAQKEQIKELKTVRDELEKIKASQMSDAEKAIATAREEGKAEGKREATDMWSAQTVKSEFKAAFAGREFDVDTFLESANTSKFLTDDGQINSQAISELAEKLAPKPETSTAYVQGNHRQTPIPLNDGGALAQSIMSALNGGRH